MSYDEIQASGSKKKGFKSESHTTQDLKENKKLEQKKYVRNRFQINSYTTCNMSDEHKVVPCISVFNYTDPDVVFRRLTKQCGKVPTVVLSVIGDADFKIKHKSVGKLKRELIDATKTTDAWLVTCGMHSGVSKFVGEAVYEYETKAGKGDVEAIGIASSKDIGPNCKFLSKEQLLQFIGKEDSKLDPNHTQFVLVDTGSVETNERDIEFRSSFEKRIFSYTAQLVKRSTNLQTLDDAKIPVVKIVLGGDLQTLESIYKSKETKIPVLVVDGTGGAADFIAKVIERKHEVMSEDILKWAEKLFEPKLKTGVIDNLRDHLTDRKITVYSVDDTKRTLNRVLQEIVFHEFKDLKNERLKREFELVYRWGRGDIAKDEIFNKSNEKQLQHFDLFEPLLTSLTEDRTDFVELLLDYFGIDSNHLHANTSSFKKDIKVPENFLCKLYEQSMDKSIAGKLIHGTIVAQKGVYNPLMEPKYEEYLSQIDKVIDELLKQNSFRCLNEYTGICENLFIWAILMNQKDMAMVFWKRNSNNIFSALIASSLLKSLSDIASSEDNIELGVSYKENARYFEHLAFDVLSALYSRERHVCEELLITTVKTYGDKTPLEIAEHNGLQKFMAHTACQAKLSTIWRGDIKKYTQTWKVVAILLCPIFAHKYIQNMEDEWKKQNKNKRHEKRINKKVMPEDQINTTKNQQKGCKISAKGVTGYFRCIYQLYSAPISKFVGNSVSYMAFLTLFSLMVLTDLHPMSEEGISIIEIIIWGWMSTFLMAEIYQIVSVGKLNSWIASVWNRFDFILYLLFAISVLLRLVLPSEKFIYARFSYTVTLGMHILRSLQFFLMSKNIGPKVIMIGKLIYDVMFFILIFTLFVVTFGVMYQAILFPNSRPTWHLFTDIIYYPYWQIYGEFFFDKIEGKQTSGCTSDPVLYLNGTMDRCPQSNSLNSLLLAVYLVLTNIILVNLLIAMFSHTFQKVQDNAELVFKFHRYRLVQEYYSKPALAPPVNILNYVFYLMRHFCLDEKENKFKRAPGKDAERMYFLEQDAVEQYFNTSKLKQYRAKKNMYTTESIEEYGSDSENDHFVRDKLEELEIKMADSFDKMNETLNEIRRVRMGDSLKKTLDEIRHEITIVKLMKQNLLLIEVPEKGLDT